MNPEFEDTAGAICARCGAKCCHEARPPLSPQRIAILLENGVSPSDIEYAGYHRIRTQKNGMCVMCSGGKCRIHAFKPETCRAGPFTFDVEGETVRIFLKHDSLCPLVPLLKADPVMYDVQFRVAVNNILSLARSLEPDGLAVISAIPEPDCDLVAEIPLVLGNSGGP
ncbi:MAG: YkgJ family cysteine cluster protein [Methanolinea sp.]|nr:YkgJ family cysteine cluster protein [Methanolinea sp.]